MKFYFNLQLKLLHRQFKDFGLQPFWGYLLSAVLFLGVSWLLFSRTSYAGYLLMLFALSVLLKWNNKKRTDFLKICYPLNKFYQIRLIENMITLLPFVLIFLYKHQFIPLALLAVAAFLLLFLNHSIGFQFTIPTPFSKKPFEFLIGFRQSFLFLALVYGLAGIAVWVDNFNLGLFSFGAFFLIMVSFYSSPEPVYYVWNYNSTANRFLTIKITQALIQSTILSSTLLVLLLAFYPEHYWIILGIQLLGYLYIICMLLVKYAGYPKEIQLTHFLLFSTCLIFPPFLLGWMPYFYSLAVRRLSVYLS